MTTGLTQGAYAGKETKLYYNSGSHASPTWVEIKRARNVTKARPKNVADVNFHGSNSTVGVAGYAGFSGSFEYVKKKGTDTVFAAIRAARDNGTIIELAHLDGVITSDDSVGWFAPVYFENSDETANGNDPTVETFAFKLADAYDASENQVDFNGAFTGTTP